MQPHPKHHLYNMQLLGQKNMINIVEITRKSMDDSGWFDAKEGNIGKKQIFHLPPKKCDEFDGLTESKV